MTIRRPLCAADVGYDGTFTVPTFRSVSGAAERATEVLADADLELPVIAVGEHDLLAADRELRPDRVAEADALGRSRVDFGSAPDPMSKRFSWRLRRAPLDQETRTREPVAATLMPSFGPAWPRLWRLFVADGANRVAVAEVRRPVDVIESRSRSSNLPRVVSLSLLDPGDGEEP